MMHWRVGLGCCVVMALLLSGCVPPPEDTTKKPTVVVKPKPVSPTKPQTPPKDSVPKDKDDKRMGVVAGLPQGWSMQDPKQVIRSVVFVPEMHSIKLMTDGESGLEVFSAVDTKKRDAYRGRLDGGHLIALPNDSDKVLVTLTNRSNARSSVLFKYQ